MLRDVLAVEKFPAPEFIGSVEPDALSEVRAFATRNGWNAQSCKDIFNVEIYDFDRSTATDDIRIHHDGLDSCSFKDGRILDVLAPFLDVAEEWLRLDTEIVALHLTFSGRPVLPKTVQRPPANWHMDGMLKKHDYRLLSVSDALPTEFAVGKVRGEPARQLKQAIEKKDRNINALLENTVNTGIDNGKVRVVAAKALEIAAFDTTQIHRSPINHTGDVVTRNFVRIGTVPQPKLK